MSYPILFHGRQELDLSYKTYMRELRFELISYFITFWGHCVLNNEEFDVFSPAVAFVFSGRLLLANLYQQQVSAGSTIMEPHTYYLRLRLLWKW